MRSSSPSRSMSCIRFPPGARCYQDLPPILRDQIAHFFRHYKDLEAGKWVNVARWADAEEAAALIAAAIARAAGCGLDRAAIAAEHRRVATSGANSNGERHTDRGDGFF